MTCLEGCKALMCHSCVIAVHYKAAFAEGVQKKLFLLFSPIGSLDAICTKAMSNNVKLLFDG